MGVKVRRKGKRWGVFIAHKGKRKALIRWDSKREAEAVAVRIRRDLGLADLGLKGVEEQVPFDTYARRWLITYAVEECKRSTVRASYRPSLETHLIPHFGSKCLTEFTPSDIRAYVEKKRKEDLNIKTVRNHLVPLRGIFSHAIEDDIISSNPVSQVRLGRRNRAKDRRMLNTLSIKELDRLLTTIEKHNPEWFAFFYTLAHTGMRHGEVVGLKWGDLNIGEGPQDRRRFIHVQRGVVDGHVTTPKTGRDRRVDLSHQLREVLMAHQVGEIAQGRGKVDDWIFCRPNKAPVSKATAHDVFKRSLALAGLRNIRIHDLRHTWATIHLRTLRSPIQWVSAQIGHASITLTIDLYGHPELDTEPTLADRFGTPSEASTGATICNLSATEKSRIPITHHNYRQSPQSIPGK